MASVDLPSAEAIEAMTLEQLEDTQLALTDIRKTVVERSRLISRQLDAMRVRHQMARKGRAERQQMLQQLQHIESQEQVHETGVNNG